MTVQQSHRSISLGKCLQYFLYFYFFCGTLSAAVDPSLLDGLRARSLGPAAVSGRIAAIDVLASNPNKILVGAATGGVWSSENGGLTWEAIFDDQPVASIGALAINQANPDIIWVGTGEGNVRNSTSIGGGIFKSVDGGRHWQLMGLAKSERINRISLHPGNPDIAYVAAMGTLWGENKDRGVYKTIDGGANWKKVLYVDERTGATDIKMDVSNPRKLYAAMWEHRRWPYYFKSGGPGSGMYISWDGGETWERKTQEDGLPEGELGRMVFATTKADAKRVYALVEAEDSALIRSDDGGHSWQSVNEEYNVADRPFYYTELAVDPENPNLVYNIATRLRMSIDGGSSFTTNPVIDCCAPSNTVHIDNHAFWINPIDPTHLIIGNDGGIAITHDRGQTWRFVRNLPLAQFYHIAVDNDHPYHVYGGLQDNGSWRGPAEVWENAGIRNLHWQEVGFGDGFDTNPDPRNSRRGYVMSQGGFLSRWDLDTGEQRLIKPAVPDGDIDLRFNWSAGFAIDPFDSNTIYYGSQFLHKSTDRGDSWATISGDLTSNNPQHQTFRNSGGLTADVTAAENYTTIVAVAPSPLVQDTLWVGSDDGRVHITRDGGENWSRIDGRAKGVKAGAWVPMIYASPHDAGTAFVVFDDHRRSDMKTYAYRVSNYGKKWKRLGGKELAGYALSILQDHVDPQLLFLGTEFGLYFSTDGGDRFTKFTAGVPTVSVMDMAIQPRENDLVLGTHGRAVYVIDDYSALRGLAEEDLASTLKILSITPGQQYDANQTPSTRFTGSGEFRADNEAYGAMVTFVVSGEDVPHPDADTERARKIAKRQLEIPAGKGDSEDDEEASEESTDAPKIEVTVHDADGKQIRRFRQTVHQGVNRLVWGMQSDGIRALPSDKKKDYKDGLPAGSEVPPGVYKISLGFAGEIASQEVELLMDPRTRATLEDRKAQYEKVMELQALMDSAVSAVERIVRARTDVTTALALIAYRDAAEEEEAMQGLKDSAGEIKKRLSGLEKLFRVPPKTPGIVYDDDKVVNQINIASYYVGSTYFKPSATALKFVAAAHRATDSALAELAAFEAKELSDFRSALASAGVGLLASP